MNDVPKYTCPFCGEKHSKAVFKCPVENRPVLEAFKLEGELIAGKYKMERRISEGGMGVIYEATHLAIERKVAVKVLHSEIRMHDDIVARFHNEAKLAASIGHRNIVDIIDMGKFRGKFYYIVMEFLQGQDLRYILQMKRKLPQKMAVDMTIQVLSALKAAHIKGIVHRDLKPENIFVVMQPSGDRYVKILDFGVSRLIDREEKDVRLTASGMVFGTPRYIPPEQAKGKATVDQRADLYSTGAILYEMLSGSPLCHSDNYNELMVEILTKSPVPLEEIAREIPRELSDVVMRSVAKKVNDRFQNAEEFVSSLVPFSSAPAYMRKSFTPSSLQPLDLDEVTAAAVTGKRVKGKSVEDQKSVEELKRVDIRLPAKQVEEVPAAGEEEEEKKADNGSAEKPLSTVPTLRPRERPITIARKNKFLVFSIIIIFIAVFVTLMGVSLIYKGKTVTQQPAEPQKNQKENEEPEEKVDFAELVIENIPESSKVYIDGVLHPERPIVVERSSKPRVVKVLLDDEVLLEEKIVVLKNISVPFTYEEKAGSGGEEAEAKGTKLPEGKKEGGKKKKGGPVKEIDEDYPE